MLRFDRCRPDGEILHPYAGREDGEAWSVLLFQASHFGTQSRRLYSLRWSVLLGFWRGTAPFYDGFPIS